MVQNNPFRLPCCLVTLFCLWVTVIVGANYVIHLTEGFMPFYSAAMTVNALLFLGLQGLHIVRLTGRSGWRRAYLPFLLMCGGAMLVCGHLGGRDFFAYIGLTEMLLWGVQQLLFRGFDAYGGNAR